jgi:hypothetical protein
MTRVARWHMYIQTKNPNLGKFGRILHWKMVYFMATWYIFSILWSVHIFFRFGMLYQQKSGNPVHDSQNSLQSDFAELELISAPKKIVSGNPSTKCLFNRLIRLSESINL